MQPHIRRWHVRYRVVGPPGHGSVLLEGGVRRRVAEPYAAALERAFAGDPAVYVLRRVHTDLTVVSPTLAAEAKTARRWAERILAAVVRTVTREADHAELLMRFEDTADYVARFLVDLLDGVAWERWYYGAFGRYRRLEVSEALRRLLMDFAEELPAILRRLAALGRLRAALGRLSPEAAGEIWRNAFRREPEASLEALRLFLRTALALAERLELWTKAPPPENELLLQYFRTSPPEPDWKQPRALAEAVYAAFLFLERTGALARNDPGILARFLRAEGPLLDSLEWLDREWLAAALRAHLAPASTPAAPTVFTRLAALSPLQRQLLQTLLQLLESGAVTLPEPGPQSHANALALFAALASAQPTLAAHAATAGFLEWLLARWQASEALPADLAFPPTQRLASQIVALLQGAVSSSSSVPPEKSLLPRSSARKPDAAGARFQAPTEARLLESSCAGLYLLSRAVLDSRLTQLASALGLSPPGVLLALAAEWTGVGPDALDPGVRFWTGWEPGAGPPSARIDALEASACERLCAAIEQLLQERAAFAPGLAPVRQAGAPPLSALALHLLRLWAHWLPGFAQASADFLLHQLIRRPGRVYVDARVIAVCLVPAALDVVLELAGYLKPIPALPWLLDRRVTFTLQPVR